MPEQATAWILTFAQNHYAAIGEREMVHLIDEPELFDVPESPAWCSQTTVWQGEVLPVMNLSALLTPGEMATPIPAPVIGIVAYQSEAEAIPQYGGLLLGQIPVKKTVSDEQACDLPEPQAQWRQLSVSCFTDNGRATPILDLPRLFADAPDSRGSTRDYRL